jgi:hypothetical protein
MKPLMSSVLAVALLLPLACGLPAAASSAEPAGSSADEPWTGTPEQRLWGLMQVWSETKAAFPHFEARPGLDWDAAARDAIPRALAAPDSAAYYAVLMELVAALGDGHTLVLPP